MVYLAAADPYELTVADYSRIDTLTEQRFAQDARAHALGISATVQFLAGEGDGVTIHVQLDVAPGFELPESLSLEIRHPTLSRLDQQMTLSRVGQAFVARTRLDPSSRYDLEITAPASRWRLVGRAYDTRTHVILEPQGSGGL
jgi:hypothetical protein